MRDDKSLVGEDAFHAEVSEATDMDERASPGRGKPREDRVQMAIVGAAGWLVAKALLDPRRQLFQSSKVLQSK